MCYGIDVSNLNGLTVADIDIFNGNDHIVITTECGRKFVFYHAQDCCENVHIYDSKGDLKTLKGKKLISVEKATLCNEDPDDVVRDKNDWDDSYTWTDIVFKTDEETVISRWFGSSNGYYSEDVSFEELK